MRERRLTRPKDGRTTVAPVRCWLAHWVYWWAHRSPINRKLTRFHMDRRKIDSAPGHHWPLRPGSFSSALVRRSARTLVKSGISSYITPGAVRNRRDCAGRPAILGWVALCRLTMCLATLDCVTSNPSLSSSPWMRGAPQSGFSTLIRRIKPRNSASICGRPPCGRDFQRQYEGWLCANARGLGLNDCENL